MRGRVVCFLSMLAVLGPQGLFSQEEFDTKKVVDLIQVISTDDPRLIGPRLRFPLRRPYPLPPTRDQIEFERDYRELFDHELVERITRSKVEEDWSVLGWRGLQFGSGTLWVDNFDDYQIMAIHHETELGRDHWRQVVDQGRRALPVELRTFDRPMMDFCSRDHRFRVDQTGEVFRLVRFTGPQSSTYDLVLEGGRVEYDGNMGDLHIDWPYQDRVVRVQNWNLQEGGSHLFAIFPLVEVEGNAEPTPEYQEVEEDPTVQG